MTRVCYNKKNNKSIPLLHVCNIAAKYQTYTLMAVGEVDFTKCVILALTQIQVAINV